MAVIINKQEYDIMICASRYKEKFSVAEMQKMLRNMGKTGKEETYARAYLNRLAEKKLVKKSYIKTGLFKRITVYQSCRDEDYFIKNTRKLDTTLAYDKKLAEAEKRKKKKEQLRMLRNPFVIAEEGTLSAEERASISKKTAELDWYNPL